MTLKRYLRVASFGACLTLNCSLALAEAPTWQLAMSDADVREVVREVGAILDQTIILDPRVQGRITVLSSEALDREGIRRLFYSVLNAQGFAAVNDGDRLLVLPASEAKAWANQQVEAIPAAFTTRVFNLSGSVAADLAGLLRPLVSSSGYIGPSSSANALVVTDSAANLDRLEHLVLQLDSGQRHDHELVSLRQARADAVFPVVEAAAGGPDSGVRVLVDTGGNRLLILGPAKSRQRMAQLTRSLDVPAPATSQNWRVVRLQHSNAEQLAEVLGEVGKRLDGTPGTNTPGVDITGEAIVKADASQNALVLLGEPQTLASVEQIILQLDQPRAQVLIHAAIVEVSGSIEEALGVQWGMDKGGLKGGITYSESGATLADLLGKEAKLPGGAALAIGSDRFAALVSALASNSRSNLLSTPSLLTLDNQEAQILVGQNVPFKTGSYVTPGSGSENPFTTVERKDIGISLKVRPHINEGNSLRLEVEQESSEIAPSAAENDLITNKRTLKSTILASDGEIIVIGGLIKDSVRQVERGVPLLSRIPWVGGLFRWRSDSQEKTNLMVFLRPTILRSQAERVEAGGRAYEGLRNADDSTLPEDARRMFDTRRLPDAHRPRP
ncbi:type II secretion system protein GspD [Pseudomonas putida SJTE-1]|uniref:Type II secretion system secretin GspD n=2 Tax=Pseudomonas TaxID=286 RepID=A0A7L9GK98_9PSED|nr:MULTISPECIES: type II secretion system secretin GspD [Pseudomonas]AFK69079.1 general secretion pathway protein D [Pseudomonas putida ND6]ANI05846.1 type II secretion system protein GspD [Pseudomonas putida SJTE-1]MEB3440444.1 type II secretion system secretin GspD [Pseudomonas sp. A2]POA83557.1 type II secretion system protein GspD [Pseudomonas sp. FW305-E2]QOJ92861.1 type II secretion system secretin GspD [Pseudomonas taiwanensis]